jgi:serine phosphatase RsbU (regulator of sigma subunit)/anti-sigma regulatory factor (Ser/Thr protein kinase)
MREAFEEHLPQLAASWLALTGQTLVGWRSEPPAHLPAAVRQSAELAPTPLETCQVDGETWLVARSSRCPQPFYLASREPGEEATRLLETLVRLLDQLIEEQATSQKFSAQLLSAWSHLNFLFDLARIAAQGGELPTLFVRLANALLQVTAAEEACLIFNEGEQIHVYTAKGETIQALGQMVAFAMQAAPLVVLQRGQNLPDDLAEAIPQLHNLLLLPIPTESQRPCLLALINHPDADLQIEEQELLFSAVEQISVVVNATLARAAQEQNRRLEHEVAIAKQIQENLLPTSLPSIPGIEFAANLKSAYLVGGDIYDVQPVKDGLAIMVSDVAGKGIPAAMLTALIHATLKSEAQHHHQPADLLSSINHLIYDELDRSGTFITAFLAVLQTNPLRLSYASAGHTTTLLWRASAQDVVMLNSTGLPLGIHPEAELGQQQLPLEDGDVLVLYSDGITEAENEHGRVFGTQALIDLLLATHTAQAQQQLNTIMTALDLHRAPMPLRDDVVLFIARAQDTPDAASQVLPFVYTAEKGAVRKLALQARQVAEKLSFSSPGRQAQFLSELELAVSEIVTNVVVHAYRDYPYTGRVQGRFTLHPDHLCIDLFDNGLTFQPNFDASAAFDEILPGLILQDPPVSGYGLIIASRLLKVCHYTHLPNGRNQWHLEKFLVS